MRKGFIISHSSRFQSMSLQGNRGRDLKLQVTSLVKNREKYTHTCAQLTFSTLMQSGTQTQGKMPPKGDWLSPHSLEQSRQYLTDILKCQLDADNHSLRISPQMVGDCVKLTTKTNPHRTHVSPYPCLPVPMSHRTHATT